MYHHNYLLKPSECFFIPEISFHSVVWPNGTVCICVCICVVLNKFVYVSALGFKPKVDVVSNRMFFVNPTTTRRETLENTEKNHGYRKKKSFSSTKYNNEWQFAEP